MSTLNPQQSPHNDRRRSRRVLLSVAVRISGSNPNGVAFSEDSTTVAVSAHGGLVPLKAAIRHGQRLKIRNQNTDEEIPCTAIDVNGGSNGIREVGVEFVAAARLAMRRGSGGLVSRLWIGVRAVRRQSDLETLIQAAKTRYRWGPRSERSATHG